MRHFVAAALHFSEYERGSMNRCIPLRCAWLLTVVMATVCGGASGARAQTAEGAAAANRTTSATTPVRLNTPPVSTSIVATVADFGWLAGTWRGEWGPRVAELVWLPPQAGVMTGAYTLMETDKVLVVELFTLVQTPNGVELYIRHFTPQEVPWEKGEATKLLLVNFDNTHFEFNNPVDGKPKTSIIQKVDADTYSWRAEIVPDTGEPQTIEITYHRVVPVAPVAEKNAGKKKKP
jgi:hypothetical protein